MGTLMMSLRAFLRLSAWHDFINRKIIEQLDKTLCISKVKSTDLGRFKLILSDILAQENRGLKNDTYWVMARMKTECESGQSYQRIVIFRSFYLWKSSSV